LELQSDVNGDEQVPKWEGRGLCSGFYDRFGTQGCRTSARRALLWFSAMGRIELTYFPHFLFNSLVNISQSSYHVGKAEPRQNYHANVRAPPPLRGESILHCLEPKATAAGRMYRLYQECHSVTANRSLRKLAVRNPLGRALGAQC
jgi:hypothetical protein